MYDLGQGVKENAYQACVWYQKAAEQGQPIGQQMLGSCYLYGKMSQKDRIQAKRWYGLACDNGNQKGCEYYGKLNRGEL